MIDDVLKERITLNRGARTLVQTMRANGAYVAIVSGGFRQFTARFASGSAPTRTAPIRS